MELMGRYAAANHALIHAHIARALGVEVLLDIENHHNFAWRERHRLPDGSDAEVIVHRKGATPAGAGVLGIIPGSMGTPGYVVRGKGVARVVEFRGARRGPPDEPHEGEGRCSRGTPRSSSCASAASRCCRPASTKCRWPTRTSTR